MALALGTSSGFVTVAPTTDPTGTAAGIETEIEATKDTSPATAGRITEVGWWCNAATEEANFEVGLYAADGATVPGEAGTLLEVSRTNAKGTTAGWKTVTVNWTISGNTNYWLAVQLDVTATGTTIDTDTVNGSGRDNLTTQTTLPDPLGGGALSAPTGMVAIYALWDEGGLIGHSALPYVH